MPLVFCARATADTEAKAEDVQTIDQLWEGFDPRSEPLEVEVFRSQDEDEGRIHIDWLYFTGQTWDGEKTRVFAYRGSPTSGKNLPGVLHIHGGGQTANIDWPRYWARRGYVCVSFDFCGDTNLPTLGPEYRREHFTKYGGIQANMMQMGGGRQMTPTPRHNPWHHWVRMARRSLTLLENHPQVDPQRIGIFGISVGGTMTWMVAGVDERVKAAVPIYGNGWESYSLFPPDETNPPPDRDTRLWRTLIAPEAHAPRITCPILFLDATNDGHGRIDLADRTLGLTKSAVKRQLFTPGYDHHMEPSEGRCLELWMNMHLRGEGGSWPAFPTIQAHDAEVPRIVVQPDRPDEVDHVELYYCLNNRVPMSRFWQRIHDVERAGSAWAGSAPIASTDDVVFALANVAYRSGMRVTSRLLEFPTSSLPSARPTLKPQLLISSMDDEEDWYFVPAYTDPNRDERYFKPWTGGGERGFTLNEAMFGGGDMNFHVGTHKIGALAWHGSGPRRLAIDVLSENMPTKLQVKVVESNRQIGFKEYVAEPELRRSNQAWTTLELAPEQFSGSDASKLVGWEKVDFVALIGSSPAGRPPVFRRLRWVPE